MRKENTKTNATLQTGPKCLQRTEHWRSNTSSHHINLDVPWSTFEVFQDSTVALVEEFQVFQIVEVKSRFQQILEEGVHASTNGRFLENPLSI